MTHQTTAPATASSPGTTSVLRRLARVVVALVLGFVALVGVLAAGVAQGSVVSSPPTAEGPVPSGHPSSDGPLVVAVVVGRSGTDAADALAPFEVFARSPEFSVYTVGATREPAALNGGLHLVPTYDFADVARGTARKPDLVVVPAVNDPGGEQEAPLRDWIVQQAHGGAHILGICAGARVLAATGLLDGIRATSHWSRITPLRKSNPEVHWVEGQRYVDDGAITTSAAISSGIPASLHVMQKLAGTAEAARVADTVRYPGWAIGGPTAIPVQHFSRSDASIGLAAVLPWFQPVVAVGLADGVGELDAAALVDAYSFASAARLVPVGTGSSVTTAHGVVLLTNPAASFHERATRMLLPGARSEAEMAPALRALAHRSELPVTPLGRDGASGFDAALAELTSSSGSVVGVSTAKMLDYPVSPAAPNGVSAPVRAPFLLALAVVLAAGVGMIPTVLRVVRRRRLDRLHA